LRRKTSRLGIFSKSGHNRLLIYFFPYERGDLDRQINSSRLFFQELKVDFVLIAPKSNKWYQYDEMVRCYGMLCSLSDRYTRCVSYGVSMGGYAALTSAARIGVDSVLAISPQYSIDPMKVPFESRWMGESKDIRFIDDEMSLRPEIEYFVAFDPHAKDDAKHVNLISLAGARPVRLTVPFGTHFLAHMLVETGFSSDLLRQLIYGTLDRATFRKKIRAHRRQSITYLTEALRQVKVRHGRSSECRLRRGLMDRIAGLETNIPRNLLNKSRILERLGQHERALEAAAAAVALKPEHPAFRKNLDRLSAKPRPT
jgi:hypothetical protein